MLCSALTAHTSLYTSSNRNFINVNEIAVNINLIMHVLSFFSYDASHQELLYFIRFNKIIIISANSLWSMLGAKVQIMPSIHIYICLFSLFWRKYNQWRNLFMWWCDDALCPVCATTTRDIIQIMCLPVRILWQTFGNCVKLNFNGK